MSRLEKVTAASVTVLVPLEVRRRNGRPRIVVPDCDKTEADRQRSTDAVLRAVARSWDWRRQLEAGGATTLRDIAREEGLAFSYVSRILKLAYLSPRILVSLLVMGGRPDCSITKLARLSSEPWCSEPAGAGGYPISGEAP